MYSGSVVHGFGLGGAIQLKIRIMLTIAEEKSGRKSEKEGETVEENYFQVTFHENTSGYVRKCALSAGLFT